MDDHLRSFKGLHGRGPHVSGYQCPIQVQVSELADLFGTRQIAPGIWHGVIMTLVPGVSFGKKKRERWGGGGQVSG